MRNCLIRNNSATQGGGLRRYSAAYDVISGCTIVSNHASASGGGIYDNTSSTTSRFENCIIYFNTAGDSYSNFLVSATVTASFANCCFSPALSGPSTNYSTNNIVTNPLFVAWSDGNYHLACNSPCINTGTNQDWMTNSVDLDGRIRIRYGIVDMGVYEWISAGIIYRMQ